MPQTVSAVWKGGRAVVDEEGLWALSLALQPEVADAHSFQYVEIEEITKAIHAIINLQNKNTESIKVDKRCLDGKGKQLMHDWNKLTIRDGILLRHNKIVIPE